MRSDRGSKRDLGRPHLWARPLGLSKRRSPPSETTTCDPIAGADGPASVRPMKRCSHRRAPTVQLRSAQPTHRHVPFCPMEARGVRWNAYCDGHRVEFVQSDCRRRAGRGAEACRREPSDDEGIQTHA